MKILSLFDGISCGLIALNRVGLKVDLYDAYEIDENAIKISKYNNPTINHKGDVFNAIYTPGVYDLIIGGSPCTYWTMAKTDGKRETKSDGLGFELFMQYARAINEVKPKYFIYENNISVSANIKNEISKILGVQPIIINSALVSAQNRKRCYWTNIPGVTQPQDKNILLNDIIDFNNHNFRPIGKWVYSYWGKSLKLDMLKTVDSLKSHTLTTKKLHPMNYYLSKDRLEYCNLNVNDWEKLQTLPLNYVNDVNITESSKYKAIGNGWTIDVIAHILSFIPKETE